MKKKFISKTEILVFSFVIVLILGIVCVIAANEINRNKTERVREDIVVLMDALANFYMDNHVYPTEKEGLLALVESANGPYVQKKYLIDPWGREYLYFFDENGNAQVKGK